jgi:hypothetical protein
MGTRQMPPGWRPGRRWCGRASRPPAAGRNQQVLDQLVARGAETAVRVDRPRGELAAEGSGTSWLG